MTARDFATGLVFPAHWSPETRARYQRWADLGLERGTQAEVDRVEARLVWVREWQEYYATTGGKDEIDELGRTG
jgi:hypothetical protein